MIPWLVLAALGLLAGDLLATQPLPLSLLAGTALCGAACLQSSVSWPGRSPWWRRTRAEVPNFKSEISVAASIGVALLAWALGYSDGALVYRPWLPKNHLANLALPTTAALRGRLIADAERRGQQTRLLMQVEEIERASGWQPITGLIAVSVRDLDQQWGAGDSLQATVALRRPRNFGNPGEFDYEQYLARQQIYVTGSARPNGLTRTREGSGWLGAMSRWRRATRAAYQAALPSADAQLLDALILGSQRELPPDLQDAFRRTGTSHILAISGLNIGLVAAAAYALFRWLLGRSRRLLLNNNVPKLATCVAIVPVFLYAGIAGTNVATVRALVMLVVLLGAVLVDRGQAPAVSLAATVIAVLAAWPGSSRDPSFQLSFAAVAGLLVGMQRFSAWWRGYAERRMLRLRGWRGKAEQAVGTYLAVSCSTMLATAPLIAFHFNQVSLIALFANALAVPLLGTVAVSLGLLAALSVLLAPPLATLFAALAWPALAAGRVVVTAFSAVPYAAVHVVSLTVFELTLVYLAAFLLLLARRRSLLWPAIALAVIIAADVAWWRAERYHSQGLRVTFLSVGHGDCAVVELPGGEVMVVDGGGLSGSSFDVGERIVAPFLWSRKIASVDYVILSHPQWDHYGGLKYLIENFSPRELWWSGKLSDTRSFRELLGRARDRGVKLIEVGRGTERTLGSVDARILAPAGVDRVSLNDGSVVLALRYAGRRVLFTGDIETAGEAAIVDHFGDELQSAVLKVPHHGSDTSSTRALLKAVDPAMAVISAGFANRFGLPRPEIVRRYRDYGAALLRTDVDGAVAVTISTDGRISVSAGPSA